MYGIVLDTSLCYIHLGDVFEKPSMNKIEYPLGKRLAKSPVTATCYSPIDHHEV